MHSTPWLEIPGTRFDFYKIDAFFLTFFLSIALVGVLGCVALLEKIAELVNDKKLEGISDLRDESDRDGMRMVIELKRDAVPAVVQNNLFKKTALQTCFSGNMLALVEQGTQPKRISMKEALRVFIDFRYRSNPLFVS
jgi:DNA gyrase/topoisomerase IV subunit A